MKTFEPMVKVIGGKPMASTLVIARGMKQQHASVVRLVRRYSGALTEFGTFGFQIQKSGGRPTEYAMLNEQQAALLISLMRNSDEVVGFKTRLIAEFYRMRDALHQRDQNLWQQLQALIAKEVESKVRASFGSHLMLDRKSEKPYFDSERKRLEAEIQPSLLN